MGKDDFTPSSIPAISDKNEIVNEPLNINGTEYKITCLSVGNPHCVVFCKRVDNVDIETIGPLFANHKMQMLRQ